MVEAAGEQTERFAYRLRVPREERTDTTDVRFAHCIIPEAEGARELALKQVVKRGQKKAVAEVSRGEDNSSGRSGKAGSGAKGDCTTIEERLYCGPRAGGGCVLDNVITSDRDCGGGGGSGGDSDGGSDGPDWGANPPDGEPAPYPDEDEWGGGGGGDGAGGSGVDCTEQIPKPGSDCEPEDPGPEVSEKRRCRKDPLKDMDIRATGCRRNGTRSVEGGRFGMTRTDSSGNPKKHGGLDLLADVGTPLSSTFGGRVVGTSETLGEKPKGWGKYVIVNSNRTVEGDPVWIVYAHLRSVRVQGGDNLSAGDLLGETGVSGNPSRNPCDGGPPHLHIEMKPVNVGEEDYNDAQTIDPEDHIGTEFGQDGVPTSDKCPPVYKNA